MTYAAVCRNLSVTFGVISDGLEVFLRILENHALFSISLLCCSELMMAMIFYLYYRFGFQLRFDNGPFSGERRGIAFIL